jgi:AAHS family 4-hydroxybenzoate transporter-like MFS transporter
MTGQGGEIVNITRAIDEGRVGAFQIRAIVLCSLVAFLDGLDTQTIGVAAPIIADGLGLSRASLGPVFSAALLGAMLGALTFGPLGDRFGRKRTLVVATVIFGLLTLATAYASSYESLLAIRFIAGIGLGGATPCFIALASEYAPKRRRAMVTSLIWTAFPLGGTLGAFLSSVIVANFKWQDIFIVGGVLPLIIAVALILWLPESIRFLLAQGRDAAQVDWIASRIVARLPGNAGITADEERVEGAPLKHLFSEGRALGTLLLWVPFLTAFGTLAIVVLWAPTLMRDNGIPLSQTALVLGFSGIGVLMGAASAGRLMERFGPTAVLAPALVLGALATAAMGYAAASVMWMSVVLVLVGAFIGMGSSGSLALAAMIYPTAIRSSGIGWAMGMGRFGQVLAPLLTALMIANQCSNAAVFVAIAVAPFIGAIAILLLRWHGMRSRVSLTVVA